ncbi:hypothetical protein EYR38_005117 [Pleurotus pulmonarius]|nr:hypothetical protein EYR38_005117 [Pleurotus pulmonarius]
MHLASTTPKLVLSTAYGEARTEEQYRAVFALCFLAAFSASQGINMGAEESAHNADHQADEETLVSHPRRIESVSSFQVSRGWGKLDADVESPPCRSHSQDGSSPDEAVDSSLAKSFSMVLLIMSDTVCTLKARLTGGFHWQSTFSAGILVAFLSLMVDIGGDDFQSSFRGGQIYDTGGTLLGLLALALDMSLAAFSGVNAAISSSKFVAATGISGRCRSAFSLQLRLSICILLQLVVAVLFDASMVFFIASYDTVIAVVIGSIILLGLIFIVYDLLLLTRWQKAKLFH